MVSSLTFRYLIHFEFIFVYGIKNILISFFYYPVFPAPFVEETVFSQLYSVPSFVID